VFPKILLPDDGTFYAIVKLDGGKKKLYTKGDIFYSKKDIDRCFRIEDIKKDILILEDIENNENLIVRADEKIPFKGSEMIFIKTVETGNIKQGRK